jgi:flagellum-specific peptidoglycan hydrolase FlgJ
MRNLPILLLAVSLLALHSCATKKRIVDADLDKATFDRDIEDIARSRPDAYIRDFAPLAMQEMQRTGIPASIKLAQAILESSAGQSRLAKEARNHFGIKCGSSWNGPKFSHYDDDKDDKGNLEKSCFRVYDDPYTSFMDHSAFLMDPKKDFRYGSLFKLPKGDYAGWARGLQKGGYATNPEYANKLISIIERYTLHKYDVQGTDNHSTFNSRIKTVYNRKAVVALTDETLSEIARQSKLDAIDLAEINEWKYAPLERLMGGETIYLERGGAYTNTGTNTGAAVTPPGSVYHTVAKGDTLFNLSKRYNTTVNNIKKLNNLTGNGIQIGQKLRVL